MTLRNYKFKLVPLVYDMKMFHFSNPLCQHYIFIQLHKPAILFSYMIAEDNAPFRAA